MFEFEVIQDLKPNAEILEIIKGYNYTAKNGKIKHLKAINLQFIEPTEYLITYPSTLTIFEYKVIRVGDIHYISLTDLAKYQNENNPSGVIKN